MTLYTTHIETPIGRMVACSTASTLCLLEFSDRKEIDQRLHQLEKRLQMHIQWESCSLLESLRTQLKEYFEGVRFEFELDCQLVGTEFQKQVWETLQRIPYGETKSYRQEAELMGKSNSVRAVANANAQNRLAIIIPCHRVISSDGSLNGYAGHPWRKKWLLQHEESFAKR